jgi:hypothetical protein
MDNWNYLFIPVFILQKYEHLFKDKVNLLQELVYSPRINFVPVIIKDEKARFNSTFEVLNAQVPCKMN